MRRNAFLCLRLKKLTRFPLLGVCLLLAVASCNTDGGTEPRIPYAPVNVLLTLTDQQSRNLLLDNGVVAVAGGVKGILVVRQNTSYLAFERNCPYRPTDVCSRVGFDTSPAPFLRDSCCGSQFSLTGQVTGGPAPRPLLQYSTSLNGNQLIITN